MVPVGVNLWQAMWLGAVTPGEGPARLERELDRLRALDLALVRILAGAEGPDDAPFRVTPTLQPSPGTYDPVLWDGLARALDALHARGMRAIVCLGNFWPWSGGLPQYVAWATGEAIPHPKDAVRGWARLVRFSARFYDLPEAREAFAAHVERVVRRFAGHPALLAWELLNEPRGIHRRASMRAWLAATAELVRSLDPSTPVTTGSEGSTTHPLLAGLSFVEDHRADAITLSTCHLWPENWGRWDPRADDDEAFARMLAWARAYLRRHAELAAKLNKPLLFEELGLARDGRVCDPAAPTRRRDAFLDAMLREANGLADEGLPVAGVLVWSWAGEGNGDPPHEPQDWYGIHAADASTLAVLRRWARG
jgi:mannan endo-1,4-beta-mannosidase